MDVSRRSFVVGAAALALGCAEGCSRAAGRPDALRLAYMGNLTHAPVMTGVLSGRLAAAVARLRLETRVVGAGPRVVEALLGGTVDVGIAGPAAIVAAQALHGPVLTIVTGVCSGGASFVLRRGETIDALGGRTVATPQIGSTQDVSLRKLLRGRSGVRITQLGGALAEIEMKRGHLAAAWMPEPWATRLAVETPADRVIDERDLWPGGMFASSVLVARTSFLRSRPGDVDRFARALAYEVLRADRDESRAALSQATHARWSEPVWNEAWNRVSFTSDPMREPIRAFARDATDLGLLRDPVDVDTLFG